MAVLDHVLHDVALALVVLDSRVFLVLLVGQLQVLAQFVDQLAVRPVVVLRPDVALYQDVYLDVGVHGQGKEALLLVVVQAVLPVYAVFGPHFAEGLQAHALLAPRVVLQQVVEDLLVEDLVADLEERHQFRELELPAHQQVQLPEDVDDLVLLAGRFFDLRLGVDEGNDEVDAGLQEDLHLYLAVVRVLLAEQRLEDGLFGPFEQQQ